MNFKRLLLVGEWQYPMYEQACAQALERLGLIVERFAWSSYFDGLLGRLQAKWVSPGPAVIRLNRDLLQQAIECHPDVVFIWRGTHVLPQTVRAIRARTGALLVSYNHDDPFGPQKNVRVPLSHRFLWRYYLAAVPEFDLHLVNRPVNLAEIKARGAKEAHALMPYYVPDLHHPVTLSEEEHKRYDCDVVFAGHYESDGRVEYLRALVGAGLRVRLFGGKYWTRRVLGSLADYLGEIRPAPGMEYAKALCGAQMCLCFLSRLNRDTYTRRCFEIPACGRLLLSERTADLQNLFAENEEAVYFSSPTELVERALWLRDHPERVQQIAQAGYRRVVADAHSVDGRMQRVVDLISQQRTTSVVPNEV